ncbi:YidC/Oxa1 family membrane protein insertase [Patescibacteria group bacterium]|nr:MAG: YidC/Oxa1 family membrane protein insertase [Patescibacteria group bacterium]
MFVASWFEVFIVKPIFNLLVAIYGLLPGHNFGLAIIVFTVVVRFLMWPLVRKQLHQSRTMRELQPELKRIKKAAAGDRAKEGMMMQELYKERGINPFGSIGILIVQLVILIGLYSGLRRVVDDPSQVISYAYSWLQDFGWLRELATDISRFDATLFGLVDLTKPAFAQAGGIYWPAMVLVLGSAVMQYFQSGQLMPKAKDGKRLRDIMRESAATGKQADSAEVNAAVMNGTRYLLPFMIVLFTVNLPSALSLYWFVGGLVAYWQQAKILKEDEQEMDKIADQPGLKVRIKNAKEAEIVESPTKPKQKKSSKKQSKKRRKQ